MGGSAADKFIDGYVLPEEWERKSYGTTILIINTDVPSAVTISGLMWTFERYGIKNKAGISPEGTCAYVGFDANDKDNHYKSNIHTIVHEGVHGLGYTGHTRVDETMVPDPDKEIEDELETVSVMAQGGSTNRLTAWSRYYNTHWITPEYPNDIYNGYPFTNKLGQIAAMDDISPTNYSVDKTRKYIYILKKGDEKGISGQYIEKLNDNF